MVTDLATNGLRLRVKKRWDDGIRHHLMASWDGSIQDSDLTNAIRIYVDGVRQTLFDIPATKLGTGYAGPEGTTTKFRVFKRSDSFPNFSHNTQEVSRVKLWRTEDVSDADATIEFDAEIAAQTEPVESLGRGKLFPSGSLFN